MRVEQSTGMLSGTWDARVTLRGRHGARRVRSHRHRSVEYFTELTAIIDPPLRLGLRADALSLLDRVRTLVGPADLHVGHDELDRLFWIRARDAEVARVVLGGVAEALVAAAEQHPGVWISDRYVTIRHAGYVRDLEVCRAALSAVGRIATRVLDTRACAWPDWEVPLAAAWQQIADAWGLTHDPVAGRLEGVVRGTRITLSLWDDGEGTTLALGLRAPLGCALTLTRQGSGFFAELFRGQDVTTGDAAFDAAYVIKGEPEARVREVLGPAARSSLAALLAPRQMLKIDDGGFALESLGRVKDPHALQDLLAVAFGAAEALAPPEACGPFRGGDAGESRRQCPR